MEAYRTAQLAKMIGVHPNTVRLYEELSLIPKPERKPNGYRIFTDLHIEAFKLARTAFQIEVLQGGLRGKIADVVKAAAALDFDAALALTDEYLEQLNREKKNASEAIDIVRGIIAGDSKPDGQSLKRSEAAALLNISMDCLRNWEMNGLLTVKRRENGYRVYTSEDIERLKIIRSLRCANYSLAAILRMLSELSINPSANIEAALDTPKPDDDIISVCDKLASSLARAEVNARVIQGMLLDMKKKFQ